MTIDNYVRAAVLVLTACSMVSLYAQTDSPSDPDKCVDQHPLLLVVREDGSMLMNADELALHEIRPVFKAILQTRSDKRVFLKASGKLRYEEVVRVISELESNSELQVVLLTPALASAPCAPPILQR